VEEAARACTENNQDLEINEDIDIQIAV